MYKTNSESNDLFIVANVDEQDNVVNFPMGGGSSTKPSVKAHITQKSAERSRKFFPDSKVVKVTGFEVVSEYL
jgi:hypothetical protein